MNRFKSRIATLSILALLVAATQSAIGHCEIPCGIYGDRMRMDLLRENTRTVEKSMRTIEEIGDAGKKNYNQLVRWITNKEAHANNIQEIVYQYFMNQRITPVAEGDADRARYVKQITLLHRMLVQAMKCKQTTDASHAAKLRSLFDEFEAIYFEDAEHNHD